MSSRVHSIINLGSDGVIIDIECHLSNNLPGIIIVGFANRAIDEAKERIRGAFMNSGLQLPRKRITVNLAPADIPKDGTSFDLAIAAAIMTAANPAGLGPTSDEALFGELGLDGMLRPVRGIIGKILIGRRNKIQKFYIPEANLAQAQLIPNVTLYPVSSLAGLYQHFYTSNVITPVKTTLGQINIEQSDSLSNNSTAHLLDDVVGQAQAKRAMIIAAAGGHNILFNGPPGTGKSMLAKCLPFLLPALSREEMLEVTHLHSLGSRHYSQIIYDRPFRAPHHSATAVSIIGGGQSLRPGEITLSHRGLLFFDELPEFNRTTLEALRQPLEDRVITVSRAKDSIEYPANFTFVATANPCPCGYFGTAKNCRCSASQLKRYQHKLSGPIIDRIDLFCIVKEVEYTRLLGKTSSNTKRSSEQQTAIHTIKRARLRQALRYPKANKLNADLTNRELKLSAQLSQEAKVLLDDAGTRLDLSARSYLRCVKVARTIADIEDCDSIEPSHIAEAIQYRSQSKALF